MLACLRALAVLAVFCPALVVNAIPQPVGIGSLDASVKYFPSNSWGQAPVTNGFSKENGTSYGMFEVPSDDVAEVIWITPCKRRYFGGLSSTGHSFTLGHEPFQFQRKSNGLSVSFVAAFVDTLVTNGLGRVSNTGGSKFTLDY
jgi:hypothetical protein